MKNLSKFCPEIFKSRLACAFLIAQLIFCAFFLDWNKTFSYIENIGKIAPERCYPAKEGAPSFGHDPGITSADILRGFFTLISFPAVIATVILMEILKSEHTQWCAETFKLTEIFAFIFFNSLYWLLLGYLIEIAHEKYARKRSVSEKPFGIFSDTD